MVLGCDLARSHPTVNHNNKRHEENYEEEVWVTNHKLTDWTKFRENYTKLIGYPPQITNRKLKFMFSTKATKIDEIFNVDLTVTTYCQIDGEDFVNFCGVLRKCELYPE